MRNSKFTWIFIAIVSLVSAFFTACPTTEEEPPEEVDPALEAKFLAESAALVAAAATVTNGTFGAGGTSVTTTITIPDAGSLLTGASIYASSLSIGGSDFTITDPRFTTKTYNITVPIKNIIEAGNGKPALETSIGVKITLFGVGVSGETTAYSSSGKSISIPIGTIAGTINALRQAASYFLPSGTIINGGAGTVNLILGGGSGGTVFSGVSNTSPITFVGGGGTAVTLAGANGGGTFVAGSLTGFGTAAAVGSISSGSFSIGTSGIHSGLNGTLAMKFGGSQASNLAPDNSGTLGTVYFNTNPTAITDNLILTSAGIKYTLPQFGVVVNAW
jgi:hypothetical protein